MWHAETNTAEVLLHSTDDAGQRVQHMLVHTHISNGR